MISDREAYILDESDVDEIRFRLPIAKPYEEFVRPAKALHSTTP